MAKKNDYRSEADILGYVAKETRLADNALRKVIDTFNVVAKDVDLDPNVAARFRNEFSKLVSKHDNERMVNEVYENMKEYIYNSLWHGRPVELRGFVRFDLFDRKEREAYNMHTGEKFNVPPRRTVRAVKMADLKKITGDISEDGTVHRDGDHPTVEARRERDREKEMRRRERERRRQRLNEARAAEREQKRLERELEKAREYAAQRRAVAESLNSESTGN